VKLLEDNLGEVKHTNKEMITKCPFCKDSKHFHLYISKDAPVFHCFHAGCHAKGVVTKLIREFGDKSDASDYFVDSNIDLTNTSYKAKATKNSIIIDEDIRYIIPDINKNTNKLKAKYIKDRLRKYDESTVLPGLILDIKEFCTSNNLNPVDMFGLHHDFFTTNFVGILSEHHSLLVARNIDKDSDFRYKKTELRKVPKSDYYKIAGPDFNSNIIVMAEGTFDIMSESVNRNVDISNKCKMYIAGLSSFYDSVIKSVCYYEQIFKMDIHILSDIDVDISYYKKIKRDLHYLINSMTIYYNTTGKDFADPVGSVEKITL
jgi:hypothetical protein